MPRRPSAPTTITAPPETGRPLGGHLALDFPGLAARPGHAPAKPAQSCPPTAPTGQTNRGRSCTRRCSCSTGNQLNVIADRPVVIYNVGTDMRWLRDALDAHGAPWPRLNYAYAYHIAQTVWGPGKPGYLGAYRLDYVYQQVTVATPASAARSARRGPAAAGGTPRPGPQPGAVERPGCGRSLRRPPRPRHHAVPRGGPWLSGRARRRRRGYYGEGFDMPRCRCGGSFTPRAVPPPPRWALRASVGRCCGIKPIQEAAATTGAVPGALRASASPAA
ncbi:hypothetical protein F4554_005584 [Actinopolymorpha rutila]|uniref:Uncharacterized protein n=1 Tax=Actinopolymorpha rutila TaxID=446787 RepID=A0A852ZW67_9ACTN|nr:hypothetical protein [Actinopolymorpha rutila]